MTESMRSQNPVTAPNKGIEETLPSPPNRSGTRRFCTSDFKTNGESPRPMEHIPKEYLEWAGTAVPSNFWERYLPRFTPEGGRAFLQFWKEAYAQFRDEAVRLSRESCPGKEEITPRLVAALETPMARNSFLTLNPEPVKNRHNVYSLEGEEHEVIESLRSIKDATESGYKRRREEFVLLIAQTENGRVYVHYLLRKYQP